MKLFKKKKIVFFLIAPILSGFLLYFFSFTNNAEALNTSATTILQVTVGATCGNNIVEGSEECDGTDLNGATCQNQGYDTGTLTCDSCTLNISSCSNNTGGGGGGTYIPPIVATQTILQGKAYPGAEITILIDGSVATIITADALANFKTTLTTLNAGVYTFGLWAEDKQGRKSLTFSFTVTITADRVTTISGIFIPPTIELEKTNLLKGDTLKIIGQAAPESTVIIQIESEETITREVEVASGGDWEDLFNTSPLIEGQHTVKAKADNNGLASSFSKVLAFYIGQYSASDVCVMTDFNKDGKTNLVDFSIMLYWWGKYNPCVDQNKNGIVDLPDFSILMYWWTG